MKSKLKSNSVPFVWPTYSNPINPNIHTLEDLCKWINDICDKEKEYTDQELADKLQETTDFCLGNNSTNSFYFYQHHRSEMIVEARVKKYCKEHKIKLEDYMGILPYRKFIIDIIPNKSRNRRLKIEKIIKKQKKQIIFNKIKSLWKRINILAK